MSSASERQRQLSILHSRIAELEAQKDGLARIATQTLSILRARPSTSRPNGIWVQEGDQAQMVELGNGVVQLGTGKAWAWAEIKERTSSTVKFPLYHTPSTHTHPRPDITPFRGAFPLEILETIVDLCDAKTMGVFAQSSLACLNIFGPKLLRKVVIGNRGGSARSLFGPRDLILFSRLTHGLSLHHIQILDVNASSLSLPPSQIHASRLAPGQPVLCLRRLKIRMDFQALEHTSSSDSDGSDYSEFSEDGYQGVRFETFRPEPSLLSLLDPEKLQLRSRADVSSQDKAYRITRSASIVISNWSRLRTVELHDVDLFVLEPDDVADGQEYWVEDPSDFVVHRSFFLGLGGTADLASTSSKEWNLRWIVKSSAVKPFEPGWKSLPQQLAVRDETLLSKRIKSATIVVANSKVREVVRAEIELVKKDFEDL